MQSSLRFQAVASRFKPFVDELHSLLAERSLAYGSPVDLPPFSEELTTKGPLWSGVRSTVRSILRQGQEPTCHGELVELILVAVGGTEVDEDTATAQRAERLLSQLVGEVITLPVPVAPLTVEADTYTFEHAPDRAAISAIQDEALEPPLAARNTVPRTEVWASPPSLVWAALLCGSLLAPCMYLLARFHGPSSAAAQGASALPMRFAARREPLIDPHLQRLLDTLNTPLSFSDDAVPAKEPALHSHVHNTLAVSRPQPLKQQSPADATVPAAAPGAAITNPVRDTDMSGPDRTTPQPTPDPDTEGTNPPQR